jgi:large subunit ribosomal protein L10
MNDYMNKVSLAINCMINLSLNTGYLVPLTAELAIQKAFMEAKSLALEANIIDKSIIDELLMKAVREAKELKALMPEACK